MAELYEKYTNIVGDGHSFNTYECKKILYHLVKNLPNKETYYSVDRGNAFNQFVIRSANYLLQVDERHEPEVKETDKYFVIINGGGDYNKFGSERFNELLKLF